MRRLDGLVAALVLGALIGLVAWSYASGGFAFVVLSTSIEGAEKVAYIRSFFEGWGGWAPLIYVAIVVVEVVVAPLPGTMLYVPGGLIFGWFVGGLTSLIGNVIGAGICCAIARHLGRPYAEKFFSKESIAKYDAMLTRNAVWVILLLRINPVTSADLVSYAAGFTSMPVWKVMLGTFLGMAPLCFVQAYFAEEIFTRFPILLVPLIVASVLYASYAVWILLRMRGGAAASRP